MPRMIQIRDVPDDVHRRLKSRAALAGMSLSEYLADLVRRSLERPTRAELLSRIGLRRGRPLRPEPAAAVRAERDGR